MSFTTGVAVPTDIPAIATIHAASNAALAAIAPVGYGKSKQSPAPLSEIEGLFAERLKDENALLIVAELDGEIAGFLSGTIENYDDDLLDSPYFTIEFIEVAQSAQGKGVASKLINYAENYARDKGITNIDLLVWETNARAIELYERLGYATLERRMAKLL